MTESDKLIDRIEQMQYAIELEARMCLKEVENGKRYKKNEISKIVEVIEKLQLKDYSLILKRLKTFE